MKTNNAHSIIAGLLIMPLCFACCQTNHKNTECDTNEITIPPAPDITQLRESIRQTGDSLLLSQYSMYYREYYPIDKDSFLYYSKLMAEKFNYSDAYIFMFDYWANKYNEEKQIMGHHENALACVDSAMRCLFEGSTRGSKDCSLKLAYLYDMGIYVTKDTLLSNGGFYKFVFPVKNGIEPIKPSPDRAC